MLSAVVYFQMTGHGKIKIRSDRRHLVHHLFKVLLDLMLLHPLVELPEVGLHRLNDVIRGSLNHFGVLFLGGFFLFHEIHQRQADHGADSHPWSPSHRSELSQLREEGPRGSREALQNFQRGKFQRVPKRND